MRHSFDADEGVSPNLCRIQCHCRQRTTPPPTRAAAQPVLETTLQAGAPGPKAGAPIRSRAASGRGPPAIAQARPQRRTQSCPCATSSCNEAPEKDAIRMSSFPPGLSPSAVSELPFVEFHERIHFRWDGIFVFEQRQNLRPPFLVRGVHPPDHLRKLPGDVLRFARVGFEIE